MAGEFAWICGVGMITPIGGHTAQTSTSFCAGISAYEASDIINRRYQPMTLALVPDDVLPPLNDELSQTKGITFRQARMLQLAHLALDEALGSLPEDYEQPLPLFLSGPEGLSGRPSPIGGRFFEHLIRQVGVEFDNDNSLLFAAGRAGGVQALPDALSLLTGGSHEYVLIGGVDSHLDLNVLTTLDKDNRVLAEGVMDGFAPGEGAAFLLLCSESAKQRRSVQAPVRIFEPGVSDEAGHRNSDEIYTGDGLTEAVNSALEALDGKHVSTILSSMNGENLNAKELGVAFSRNSSAFEPTCLIEHPADCFGDVGAAAMPVLTGLATEMMKNRKLTGPALICCSSEGSRRGAVCIDTR
jgi:3-oxoacyl-[acyl-carrier-protein] synthase-1